MELSVSAGTFVVAPLELVANFVVHLVVHSK